MVGTVNATDSDGSERNSHVNYFIVDGAADKFIINASNGDVIVQTNAVLDRETVASYNLTILAVDQGYPAKTGSTSMIITIDDVNDTPPEFTNMPYQTRILENKAVNSDVYKCSATDKDVDIMLEFSILAFAAVDEDGQEINHTLVQVHCLSKGRRDIFRVTKNLCILHPSL